MRKKTMSVLLAAALAAALFAGGTLAATKVRGRAAANLMPEVAVTAEKPRIVVPTVEVRAYRAVATSTSAFNIN